MKTLIKGLATLCLIFGLTSFASETVEGAKKDYESFKQEMSLRLQEIDKKIENLKEESKERSQVAKRNTIKELESARDKLKSDLKEVKKVSTTTWSKFKSGFADSVDSLNTKIQKALKE